MEVSPWCCWLLLQVWSYRVATVTRAQPSVGSLRQHRRGFRTARITGGCCGEGCDQGTAGSWEWAGSAGVRGKTSFPCLLEKLFQATCEL